MSLLITPPSSLESTETPVSGRNAPAVAPESPIDGGLVPPQLPPAGNPAPVSALGLQGRVLRLARRLSVLVLGISVLLAGVIMLVTPGPAVVVIPLGLGILATEFVWARRVLDKLTRRFVAGQDLLPDSRLTRWLRKRVVRP